MSTQSRGMSIKLDGGLRVELAVLAKEALLGAMK